MNLKRLIIISRPVAWVGLASFFWWGVIASESNWNVDSWTGLIYFTFPASILVLGFNDISDIASDRNNPRKGSIDGAVVQGFEKRSIISTAIASLFLFELFLIAQQRYLSGIAVLVVASFGYDYSFKPFRLKNIPIADSASNGLWVVAIFLAGFFISTKGLVFTSPPWRYVAMFFFSFSALHAFATLIDYDADKTAGDTTVGIFLGKSITAWAGTCLFAVSTVLAFKLNWVLFAFYCACTLLALFICFNPTYLAISRVKNIFYGLGLVPLPALYLLLK